MKKGRPLKTVARRPVFKYHEPMEVQLTFDQEAKLTRMATEQGRAAETLVQESRLRADHSEKLGTLS
jgi:hypothetical protein